MFAPIQNVTTLFTKTCFSMFKVAWPQQPNSCCNVSFSLVFDLAMLNCSHAQHYQKNYIHVDRKRDYISPNHAKTAPPKCKGQNLFIVVTFPFDMNAVEMVKVIEAYMEALVRNEPETLLENPT